MRIESILIVHDGVTELHDGVPTFVAVGDMGVVFVLDGACIAFTKGGWFSADLFITTAPTV